MSAKISAAVRRLKNVVDESVSDLGASVDSLEGQVGTVNEELAARPTAVALAASDGATKIGTAYGPLSAALKSNSDQISAYQLGQNAGVVGFNTLANLNANLGYADKTVAYVTSDAAPANNGVYRKSGAAGAGAWVKGLDTILDNSITPRKLNFVPLVGVPSKNLFNLTTAAAGQSLDSNNGNPFASAGYYAGDWMAVSPSTQYYATLVHRVYYFTAANAFISSATLNSAAQAITTPENAAYMRAVVLDANVNKAQIELGTAATAYVLGTHKIPSGSIVEQSILDNSLPGVKVKDRSIYAAKLAKDAVQAWHFKGAVYDNLYNKATDTIGSYLNADGITSTANASFRTSDWIPVKPNTQYTRTNGYRVFFYDADRNPLGWSLDVPFMTPAACEWLRTHTETPDTLKIEQGAVNTPYKPYAFTIPGLNGGSAAAPAPTINRIRSLNLADAWYAWNNGEKFPVAFLGDSTTEGAYTTGYVSRPVSESDPAFFGTDYQGAPNAYCAVLERLIRKATGSTTARIYNAGYFGRGANWAAPRMASILSGAYADVKMLGISMGINDRENNYKTMATAFYQNIETIIKYCLDKGIQPFLLTTHAKVAPAGKNLEQIGFSAEKADTVANQIKKNLADKWGLELVDMMEFTKEFQTYSGHRLAYPNGIYSDDLLHYHDIGFKYEAEVLFAHLCPRVIMTDRAERLDFGNQHLLSSVLYPKVGFLATPKHGFKLEANFTKDDSADMLLQDFWLFNRSRGKFALSAYVANALGTTHVKLNDVNTVLTAQGQQISDGLEMGLHHIEAWTGGSTTVDFLGFKTSIAGE